MIAARSVALPSLKRATDLVGRCFVFAGSWAGHAICREAALLGLTAVNPWQLNKRIYALFVSQLAFVSQGNMIFD